MILSQLSHLTTLTPGAIEYVKYKQGYFGLVYIFCFGHDYNLMMALVQVFMYDLRGHLLVSLV